MLLLIMTDHRIDLIGVNIMQTEEWLGINAEFIY